MKLEEGKQQLFETSLISYLMIESSTMKRLNDLMIVSSTMKRLDDLMIVSLTME